MEMVQHYKADKTNPENSDIKLESETKPCDLMWLFLLTVDQILIFYICFKIIRISASFQQRNQDTAFFFFFFSY